MKTFIAPALLLFLSFHCFAQNKIAGRYAINGHIQHLNGKYIYFSCKGIGVTRVWDSTIVKKNSFRFTGYLKEPSNGFITTLTTNRVNNLDDAHITDRLFVGPYTMSILLLDTANFHTGKLTGSKYQTEYDDLEASKKEIYKKRLPLSDLYDSINHMYLEELKKKSNDSVKQALENTLDSLWRALETFGDELNEVDKAFYKQHPSSYITGYLLQFDYLSMSLAEMRDYYFNMNPEVRKWEYGLKLKKRITGLQKASPGAIAANFNEKDINGDSLSLMQFRGKYVLLDFWASWCKPCRAGNPELIKLYNKYKNNGIEFIGIADDEGDEDKWKAAVEKDKVNIWRHIIDRNIGNNYEALTIPMQILIDPTGKIIARFGGGGEPNENIGKTLQAIFEN